MAEKKQALLLFCKPPVPGLVKTRLTIERGGFLSPEQAAELFRRCLYDVSEMCMQALLSMQADNDALVAEDPSVDKITYDFFVSTTPADNVELMRETYDALGKWPMEITHISQAFQWLDYFQDLGTPGFVQAPCQECGTSLVGFSYNTPINHQGVYYNLTGKPALDAYVEKLQEMDIPSAYFTPVADIDEKVDLAHAVSCIRAIKEAAKYQTEIYVPQRVLDWCDFMNIRVSTPPNDNHDPRQYIDEE